MSKTNYRQAPLPAHENLPHNIEAERALLGSIILDNECLVSIMESLNKEDFYSEAHRLIYTEMLAIREARHAIDPVTLGEELRRHGALAKVGSPGYISALTDGVPIGTTAAVPEYIRIVRGNSTRRRMVELAENLKAKAEAGIDTPDDLTATAYEQIQDLRMRESAAPAGNNGEKSLIVYQVEPEGKKPKPNKQEYIYPVIPRAAWHPKAEIYRQAHEHCSEGSDNWHFISFYTVVGAMFGRTLGTRMGSLIYPNLYSVLIGQIGGDGKDTTADFGTDFVQMVDPTLYIPETIDSKAGFCKAWMEYNQRYEIVTNHRALLRLPEIRSYLDTAEQSGTKSIAPMLLTQYSARSSLDNSSRATDAHIPNPHLCMLACGAKRFIGQIPEVDLINGLGRRVCFVPGDPKGPNADPENPNQEILVPLADSVKESLAYYLSRKNCLLTLSPEAHKLWDTWYKTYWKRKSGDDLFAALNNGDRTTCRKIALINAGLDRSEKFITPAHLEPAMAAVEFLFECRYPIFSEHGANPYVEVEKKIMDKIPEYPNRVQKRWVQRYLRGIDAKTFNERIKYLTMEDGPVMKKIDGRKIWLSRNP